jgi:hypothetical protein
VAHRADDPVLRPSCYRVDCRGVGTHTAVGEVIVIVFLGLMGRGCVDEARPGGRCILYRRLAMTQAPL